MIGFVLLLLVIPKDQDADARTPRRFIVWSISVFFVVFLTFTVTAFAFSWPCNWVQFLNINFQQCKGQTIDETKPENSKEGELQKDSKLMLENLQELDIGVTQAYIKQILGEPKFSESITATCGNKTISITYDSRLYHFGKVITLFEKGNLISFLVKKYDDEYTYNYLNQFVLGKQTYLEIDESATLIYKFDAHPYTIQTSYFGRSGGYNYFYFSSYNHIEDVDKIVISKNSYDYALYATLDGDSHLVKEFKKQTKPNIVAIVGEKYSSCELIDSKKPQEKDSNFHFEELIMELLTHPFESEEVQHN